MAHAPEIVLYDSPSSPCGRRVRLTLLEKGLPFEIRWIDLGTAEQKQPWFLEINPNGTVPAVLIDGEPFYESNVIAEYVDRLVPAPPLMPDDPLGQARVRMWMAYELAWAKPFVDAVYETHMKRRVRAMAATEVELIEKLSRNTTERAYIDRYLAVFRAEPDPALVEDRIRQLMARLALLDKALSDGRPWLMGDRFTLADIALGPRLDMFPAIGVTDLGERLPRIGAFLERIRARPSWSRSVYAYPWTENPVRVAAA